MNYQLGYPIVIIRNKQYICKDNTKIHKNPKMQGKCKDEMKNEAQRTLVGSNLKYMF